MWDFIDKVIYINLDHREDRREIMKKFFERGNIPIDKIIRFSAIKENPGIIGSAKSHISCLKLAIQKKWDSVLILEDDLTWVNFEENYKKLESLMATEWDVCLLGGGYLETELPNKIIASLETASYIVKSHYYQTLLSNFETGLCKKLNVRYPKKISFIPTIESDRIKFLKNRNNQFNIDVYWIKLQLKDNWVGIIDPMCQQTDSYSDNLQDSSSLNKSGNVFREYIELLKFCFINDLI